MQETEQYEWGDFRDIENGKCRNKAEDVCYYCNNEQCIYNKKGDDHNEQ